MDWSGLWHGILSNGIYAILILGGGAVLAVLRRKWPDLAPTVLYGVAGATCAAVLMFTLIGRGLLVSEPPTVTPENVEENIKLWAEHLGMNIGPANEPDSYFAHTLSIPRTGVPVEVFRLVKEKPGYLQFKVLINVSVEHQTAFSKMSQAAVNRISQQLDLDIGRANLGCTFGQVMAMNEQQHKTIIAGAFLLRGIPIANLNEVYFIETYDQLTRGTGIVQSFIRLAATTPL